VKCLTFFSNIDSFFIKTNLLLLSNSFQAFALLFLRILPSKSFRFPENKKKRSHYRNKASDIASFCMHNTPISPSYSIFNFHHDLKI